MMPFLTVCLFTKFGFVYIFFSCLFTFAGGNLAWAKAGQPLKGFGYAYDVHQKSDNTLSKTLVLKKIGPTLSQSSFSIKYDTNMDVLKKSLLISSPGFSNGVRFEVQGIPYG